MRFDVIATKVTKTHVLQWYLVSKSSVDVTPTIKAVRNEINGMLEHINITVGVYT